MAENNGENTNINDLFIGDSEDSEYNDKNQVDFSTDSEKQIVNRNKSSTIGKKKKTKS